MAIRTASEAQALQQNITTVQGDLARARERLAAGRWDEARTRVMSAQGLFYTFSAQLPLSTANAIESQITTVITQLNAQQAATSLTWFDKTVTWVSDQLEVAYNAAVRPAVDESVQTIRAVIAKYDFIDADIRFIETTYQQLRTMANAQNIAELRAQQLAAANEVGSLASRLRQQLNQQTVKVETLRDLLRQAASAGIISQGATMGAIFTTGALIVSIIAAAVTVASIMYYLATIKSAEAKVTVQEIKAAALKNYQAADSTITTKVMTLQDQINALLLQPQSAQRDAQIVELRSQIAVLQGMRPQPIPDDFFKDGSIGADIPWGWILVLGGGAVGAYFLVNWLKHRTQ